MQLEIILVCLGILLFGVIIFLIQVFRNRHHDNKTIQEYKEARNKLTLREKISKDVLYVNTNFDVMQVVKRLIYTVLSFYVGGTVLDSFGSVMNGTTSEYYPALSLIGWNVVDNTIKSTDSTVILPIVGIIGIISVLVEFINVKQYKVTRTKKKMED